MAQGSKNREVHTRNSISTSGRDPLFILNDLKEALDASETVVTKVCDLAVSPRMMPQASQLSTAFQRYLFNRLMFDISSTAPSNEGVRLTMGWVPDPDETLPEDPNELLEFLLSRPGSRSIKVWERLTFKANVLRELRYTSPSPTGEKRLSLAGRFVCVATGKLTASGSLHVMADWGLTFMQPGLEAEPDANVVDAPTAQNNGYGSDDTIDLDHIQGGTSSGDILYNTEFSPNLELGAVYAIPRSVAINLDTTNPNVLSTYVHVSTTSTPPGRVQIGTWDYSTQTWKNPIGVVTDGAPVILKGDRLVKIWAPPVAQNAVFRGLARPSRPGHTRPQRCADGAFRYFWGSRVL